MRHPFLSWIDSLLAQEIIPNRDRIEETAGFPRSWFEAMGRENVFGVIVPQSEGGLGLPVSVLEEYAYKLALVTPGLALAMGIPIFTTTIISKYAEAPLRQSILPVLCRGEAYCAFAYTEEAQSGITFATRAAPSGDGGYRLSGRKRMISGAGDSEYYLTVASVEIPETGSLRPSVFLVHRDMPGVSFGPVAEKMAFPALAIRDLTLENVAVPAENLLGKIGLGLKIAHEALHLGRLCVSTVALAIAQASLDAAVDRAVKPRSGGGRLADLQTIQFKLAEMKLTVEASRHLLHSAWCQWESQDPNAGMAVAMAKAYAARAAVEVADAGLQLQGGEGFLKGHPQERRYRQARLFGLIEGTTEIQLAAIANRLLAGK